MVLEKEFPPDIRVEKEARSLMSAGYEVYLLSALRSEKPIQEEKDGIIIRRISLQKSVNYLGRKLNSLSFFLSFQNKFWGKEMERFVDDFQVDVLHIHDLPLVGTGIKVARNKGIKVLADLHENYPAGLQVWKGGKKSLKKVIFQALFNNLSCWTRYEMKCVQEVDKVIVVVDEAKKRLMDYGIPEEKIAVLMNVEDVDYFSSIEFDKEIISQFSAGEKFVLIYIGGFGSHRGLDVAIRALPLVLKEVPSIELSLIGSQSEEGYTRQLRELARSFNVQKSVEILPWQPLEKVPSYMKVSDVGLIPHYRSPHTDSTIPHKLFQYMLMGKPVIVSDCLPLKRIVHEAKCGLVFEAGNAADLARQIKELYFNKSLRDECGKLGREAVLKKYNWREESKKLVLMYESLSRAKDGALNA